ncbi:MAG: spore coat U domain-containing protein [Pseudomonadota bacterium]
MLRVQSLSISLATVFLALASNAGAATYSNGTNTSTFDVSVKIVANCTISASNLDFGQSQGVLTTAVNVNTSIAVTCSDTTPYNVGLNAGTGAGSVGTSRNMSGLTAGNSATIHFNLFQAAGATLWGNTQGTDTKGGVGNGTAQTLSVYGQIPAQTTPMPDTYKSTITATVYF